MITSIIPLVPTSKNIAKSIAWIAACFILFSVASSLPSHADEESKTRALRTFEKGNTQYNLGNWQRAVLFFKEAYEAYPAPEFLFNLGQSYRRAGNCERSVFFYKRYLDLEKSPLNLIETESHLESQKEACRQKERSKTKANEKIDSKPVVNSTSSDINGLSKSGNANFTATERLADPYVFFADFYLGASKWNLGEEFKSPVREYTGVFIGTAFKFDAFRLRIGPHLGMSFFGHKNPEQAGRTSGAMIDVLLRTELGLNIHSKFSIGLHLGMGTLVWSGISDPNIFVKQGLEPSGPLVLALFEMGLHLKFRISRRLDFRVSPLSVKYSPGRKALVGSIRSLTSVNAALGLGIRF